MGGVLIIRGQQRETLRQAALRSFATEMVEHCHQFSPRLCRVLGKDQVRVVVDRGIAAAASHGFTKRGPVRLYIEMMLLFGSGFDADPQYPWASAILADTDEPQMERADRLYSNVTAYLDAVHGPDSAYLWAALKEVSILARRPLVFTAGSVATGLLDEMRRTFPQKYAYVGEDALHALVGRGEDTAARHGFDQPREVAVVIILMFAFGHGFDDDPLYPWISRTLTDENIVDPRARAKRLETKAVTWLDHVLAPGAPAAGAAVPNEDPPP